MRPHLNPGSAAGVAAGDVDASAGRYGFQIVAKDAFREDPLRGEGCARARDASDPGGVPAVAGGDVGGVIGADGDVRLATNSTLDGDESGRAAGDIRGAERARAGEGDGEDFAGAAGSGGGSADERATKEYMILIG